MQTRKFIAFYCPTYHILTVGNIRTLMKFILKTGLFILLFNYCNFVSGQNLMVFPNDTIFQDYEKEIYSLKRSYINPDSIFIKNEPDTLEIVDSIYCRYHLKYLTQEGPSIQNHSKIGIEGNLCDFLIGLGFDKPKIERLSQKGSYRIAKFGNEFIVVFYSLPTGLMNNINYYFELIKEE